MLHDGHEYPLWMISPGCWLWPKHLILAIEKGLGQSISLQWRRERRPWSPFLRMWAQKWDCAHSILKFWRQLHNVSLHSCVTLCSHSVLSEQPVTEEQMLPDSTYIMDLKTVKSIDESWFLEDGERRKRSGGWWFVCQSLNQEPLPGTLFYAFYSCFLTSFFKKYITYLFFFYQHWNFVCL